MSRVLVDTSIWIDYFKGNEVARPLVELIETGNIVTNDLVLTELLPSIRKKKEAALEEMLLSIEKVPMNIDWTGLAGMQFQNLSVGNNNMGIPDLMIFQNAIQNSLTLFENDKHFRLMGKLVSINFYRKEDV